MLPPTARRPLSALPKAAASCAETGAIYGQCIGARYQDVTRDMCKAEFEAFRRCVQQAMKK